MSKFTTMLKRDIINIVTNPTLLTVNTIFTFLLIIILGFIGRSGYGDTGVDSYDYYGITIMVFAVLNVAMTATNSFMEKSLKASNLRVIFSPIPSHYIYTSKILATFIFTAGCISLNILLCSIFLGVNFGGMSGIYVISLLLLFNLMSCAIGVMFCCIFKSEELSNKILSLAINVFAILGGVFFRLDSLGDIVSKITYLSPAKWVIEAIFRIIYDGDFSFFIPTIFILASLSLLFIAICKLTFRTEDYV